jgi:hypothetical protein
VPGLLGQGAAVRGRLLRLWRMRGQGSIPPCGRAQAAVGEALSAECSGVDPRGSGRGRGGRTLRPDVLADRAVGRKPRWHRPHHSAPHSAVRRAPTSRPRPQGGKSVPCGSARRPTARPGWRGDRPRQLLGGGVGVVSCSGGGGQCRHCAALRGRGGARLPGLRWLLGGRGHGGLPKRSWAERSSCRASRSALSSFAGITVVAWWRGERGELCPGDRGLWGHCAVPQGRR